ncbi:MAG: dihydrolipoyl dehydrogenase [Spirochaetaceae bacterium]|jgi:dihydrolipoamide dehydrogenase|nr:dihydrolipoyl dehydrogenase [Spirochaetaceae bacterium]
MAEFDIAVIGGGPAGYVGAIKAAQLGARTVLIEKDQVGGTCLNRGCIPTKALLKTAKLVHEIAEAPKRGIKTGPAEVDMAAVIREKNRVVKKLTGGVASLLSANGVELIRGEGKLLGGASGGFNISVTGQSGIRAKKVLLAGGSQTAKLPIPGLDLPGVLGSTEILDLEEIPRRLVVIGGGVIGIEMAMIFRSFGSKITVIEAMPRILPFMDHETSALIHKILAARGVEILSGVGLSKIEKPGDFKLILADGKNIEADSVLVSIGRTGDLSCLGGEGIQTERGKILVNDYMETSVPGVFAPGDINGKKMLAHAAFKMAETAAENAAAQLGLPGSVKKPDLDHVPSVVYCFPEAAAVGLTQEEAEKEGAVAVGRFPLAANGKALSAGQGEGFVKILSDQRYGKLLGVHMVGSGASEIINEAAALMAMEITVHELAEITHGHPTVSEALMEAAADCLGKCIHLPPKGKK